MANQNQGNREKFNQGQSSVERDQNKQDQSSKTGSGVRKDKDIGGAGKSDLGGSGSQSTSQ